MPDLPALELLLAVARLGSLGKAAREVGVSQPAASARMRTLERLVGVPLLERTPRGSVLTSAGLLVTDWARPLLEAADELDVGLAALREDQNSRLRVEASLTVAEYLLPRWLVALRQARPGVAVSLRVANSTDVAARVLAGEADLGFTEGSRSPRGLDSAVVAHDRLTVVVAPGHPWARRRRPVPAAELAATPLVQREQGSGTREVLAAALGKLVDGEPAAPLLELASTTALKAAAVSGAGPAVLSSLAVADDLAAGRLIAVEVADLPLARKLRAVWRHGTQPRGPARELLSLTGQ
ncbi:LysR family transcriptional regulator [Yinghuangia seranimata]|uniref:LysR family transcriptional regulator n=1 Tax=Yinghuangia seranimata TaxID=408067 RepID=UPI00248B67F6|nr:LysR family transcriptional regulator [Yinghuangia seranimata]MDI2125356.1 LysR family transcriptional regulator [Yinghuangia seranimata]